jgi:hypothetical protein
MSGGNPIHVCYYSNKCQWSKAFLTELKDTPWKSQFHFVCVDPSPTRPQLPSWLKKVPTIVLKGEPTPRTDSDVMNWLYEKRQREGSASEQQGPAPGAGGEPDAWNVTEQGNFNRGFSYSGLDVDTSSQGNGGATMPGAFSFLNGAAAFGDKSQGSFSPAGGVGTKKSKKEELFDKQMEAYQNERENGMPRFQKRS